MAFTLDRDSIKHVVRAATYFVMDYETCEKLQARLRAKGDNSCDSCEKVNMGGSFICHQQREFEGMNPDSEYSKRQRDIRSGEYKGDDVSQGFIDKWFGDCPE